MTVETVEKSIDLDCGMSITLTQYCPSNHFDYDSYFTELLDKMKAIVEGSAECFK